MVESSKTSLPALVDYIAFAQDRELMNLIGNGKNLHSRAVPTVIPCPRSLRTLRPPRHHLVGESFPLLI